MHSTAAIVLALQCTLCLCIRVPIVWNDDNSEVNNNNQFAVDTVEPQNDVNNNQKPIPIEYFQYTAQKPKFAVDIAKFHGVQSPENLYKSHPIVPHTGVTKPELGKHHMLEKEKKIFHPFQTYVNKNEAQRFVTPATTNYEIFHPYKLEEPALKELYQDPVMDKIRNDLLNSKNRLQKHENEAGEPDITKNEYLESPEETDRKKFPHRNIPATYEIHRPQRRPVYYRPPSIPHHREHILNQKFRHPWHQNYVKVKPLHYRPVKNHLQRLRQQHALKYDDENNEYPQLPPPEKYSDPSDGYDIYEKGKAKFIQLRNNVDESINESIQKNRPIVNQKLELNNDESHENSDTSNDEDEFIPIKNYAQVRRTETTKHLPKEAAFHDADTLDEIRNAPRLREAIKSTKAQTVYSEEGYEDSAYDHAGEQKHASDHEGHGGFLKEKELSGGKYKTPTFAAKYKDEDSSEYRDQVLDGKKWKDNKKDTEEEIESEDYSEIEKELSAESDIYNQKPKKNTSDKINKSNEYNESYEDEEIDRLKRADIPVENHVDTTSENNKNSSEHDVNKREAKIEIPEVNLNTTYLTQKEILKLPLPLLKLKELPKIKSMQEKYPYYYKKLKSVSKDSPLRYAENLRLIPKKSEGGTEFYDSRSKFECPEVDDKIDPIPEKLKKEGHPDEDNEEDDHDVDDNEKDKADFSGLDEKPRLSGLGDKIDCFKAKYFGENPLDSPFFQEEIISNPEPVTVPSIEIYKLKQAKEKFNQQEKFNTTLTLPEVLTTNANYDSLITPEKSFLKQNNSRKENGRILKLNSEEIQENPKLNINGTKFQGNSKIPQNSTYLVFEQKQDVTKMRGSFRKRRSTPFIYEPYKIIKDSQIQDSKKTTTTNNISPLIKQLQSSRVVDRVATNQGKDQVVKRNARTYKDIGKNDREKSVGKEKGSQPIYDTSFVDVSVDQRRGEPKYQLRPNNHKSQYTPVENRKSMTMEDYNIQSNAGTKSEDYDLIPKKQIAKDYQINSTTRPYFDVSKFLPHTQESKQSEKSGAKQKETELQHRSDESSENTENEDDYGEYDDDDNNEQTSTTTTTTIRIPQRRRKTQTTSTTEKSRESESGPVSVPKLRLITRFRDSYDTEKPETVRFSEKPTQKAYDDDESITVPKYREKKKKSSKSTLVTDTKSYGEDDDDDLRKEEVDALIGVKQNAKEYMPEYEKLTQKKDYIDKNQSKGQENEEDHDDDNDEENHDEDEDSDDDNDEDEDEDDDDEDEEDEDDDDEVEVENEKIATTPEPTKRTLAKTTEAPLSTTEARELNTKLEDKPVIVKKKIEIHKELPVNRSSPHITEFKQDIKEVEIIKEITSKTKKKPQKNIEALELYKDENLAKDVNKLGAVEVFKEGLDLVNGPKHGGNYKSAEGLADKSFLLPLSRNKNLAKDDVVASQSKTSKHIEVKDDPHAKGKAAYTATQRIRGNRGRSAKLIELSDSTERATSRPMHGGNLKSIHDERRRGSGRNAKLIELDDSDSREDHSTNTHGDDFKSYGSRSGNRNHMHGGNYRSAKIIKTDNAEDTASNKRENVNSRHTNKDGRRNAAMFLSSIASAVPVMTTTPVYILDPSKRMYYYVDA